MDGGFFLFLFFYRGVNAHIETGESCERSPDYVGVEMN